MEVDGKKNGYTEGNTWGGAEGPLRACGYINSSSARALEDRALDIEMAALRRRQEHRGPTTELQRRGRKEGEAGLD